jgi:hypothetical protein
MAGVDRRAKTVTITTAQARFLSWTTDVLIYTVVLNLFVEYVDAVVIDSFTISLFTAVLLKLLLDVLEAVEHRLSHSLRDRGLEVLSYAALLAVLFVGKFVILEVVDIVFGDHVSLGYFIEVAALVISMIAARELMNWVYRRLGLQEESEQTVEV